MRLQDFNILKDNSPQKLLHTMTYVCRVLLASQSLMTSMNSVVNQYHSYMTQQDTNLVSFSTLKHYQLLFWQTSP